MRARIHTAIDGLLTTPPHKDTKAGLLYAACMANRPNDLSTLSRFGPVLQAVGASGTYESVVKAVATLHSNAGGSPLFSTAVRDSRVEYGVRVLRLDRPSLGMSRAGFRGRTCHDQAVQASYRQMLRAFMSIAQEAGLLRGTFWPDAAAAADAVYAFEERLQVFKTIGYKAWRAARDNMLPVASTTDLELPAAVLGMEGVQTPKGTAMVKYPAYFGALNKWIRAGVVGNAQNGRAVLQTYLAYKVTRSFAEADLLGPDATAAWWAYRMVVKGTKAPTPRLNRCASRVGDHFPIAVTAAFMAEYFDNSKAEFARSMVTDIRAATAAMINASDWMDGPTTAAALEKLAATEARVADNTPNGAEDDTTDIVIKPGDYSASYLSAATHDWRRQWHRLAAPRADRQANLRGWETNAAYSSSRVEIYIPAGILQSPAFAPSAPHALTFGGIGRTIGHEYTHGFDNRGRAYDGRGLAASWWSPESDAAFYAKARCLVNLFDGYVPPDLPASTVDGAHTLPENIADAGGIRSAWAAWQRRSAAGAVGPTNAVLSAKFSNDQLFFLGFAQTWCRRVRVERQAAKLKSDVHSPARFRAEGTLSQFAPFAAAFKCPPGSRYNPPTRCSLW
ncbi:hypothetical protein BU14_0096s0005 [Porphyra umbilicalis]|uniref:Peptidase M13 C-terminal domain-containing protein n=1 Tax=Porphyra umbilicalis TaxID=2786 RepID=A0A1X6PDA9_PORUM|nr:hypothetical protein BU14_0096s0005 [Porphyra umbilicalis]|eukprot:OSX78852.1 hypothetical protein BU14_0096s0005 [Porphyra umbilicalis]